MAGGNNPHKPSAAKPSPSASNRKPLATSANPKPKPPPPAYGFHMLERRTIVLFDNSVRSYFALPPDYHDGIPNLPLPPRQQNHQHQNPQDYWNSLGLDGQAGLLKRKYVDEEVSRQMAGREFWVGGTSGAKVMRVDGRSSMDLKKAFLYFVKAVNADAGLKKKFLENGKMGALKCLVCGRSSKDFPDMHALVMHTYNSESADNVDHLGLHKALCVLMGWNFSKPPDNSKAYQFLPAGEAVANQEDLIIWPPTVIIHNTLTGKNKDGRMEGLGNKAMDSIIRDFGCVSGKSSALYAREGHLGVTMVKFVADQSGVRDAVKLAEYFEKQNRGRKSWDRIQPIVLGKDDEKNPNLMKVDERTGEKRRIFYGYLATAFDLEKLNFETKKKVTIESRKEYMLSN